VVALMDAFRGEVYSAVSGAGRRSEGPRVGSLEAALAGLPAGAAFVGDAVDGLRSRIESLVNDARFPPVDLFLAARLGLLALERVARGEVIPARELRPLYLRGAEIRRQAR
jgi:tRNA A37 threonylcarbamoyladenosine modification protein TsaB